MQVTQPFKSFFAVERNVLVLGVSSVFGTFGTHLWMNIFSLYIYTELKASPLQVGYVFTIGALASALLMMPIGYIADKIGKKTIIVAGCYVMVISQLLFATARSWIWLIPFYFLYATAGAYHPQMMALIADSVTRKKRGTAYAFFSTLPSVAAIFAAGIGGYFSEMWGFRPLFILAAALSLIMAVIRHAFLIEPKEADDEISSTFTSPFEGLTYLKKGSKSFKSFFIFVCVGAFSMSLIFPQYYALYGQNILHLSRTQIGLAFSISLAFSAIFFIPGGRFADWLGRKKLIAASLIVSPILLISYLFAPNVLVVYLISAITGLFSGLSRPSLMALRADLMPRGKRGTMMGLFAGASSLTGTPSPMIGGYLWQTVGPKLPFYIAACSSILSLMILVLLVEETLKKEDRPLHLIGVNKR
jgi:MFS family permease